MDSASVATTAIFTTSVALETESVSGNPGGGRGTLQTVAYCVMATIIAIGSIGNCIVLYVYARKKDGHAANIFIMSLAVSDTIACVLVIPMSIAMEVNDFNSNVFMCKLYYLLNCSGIPFSSMLMSAIAVERYFSICRPFLRAINVPRAKAIVLTLGATAFTLGVTTAVFCSAVVRRFPDGYNGTVVGYTSYGECREISDIKRNMLTNTSLIHISDASLVFYNIFQKLHLSLFGVCIVLVFGLYVKIYHSVLRLRQKRRERHQNRLQLAPVGQQPSVRKSVKLQMPEDEAKDGGLEDAARAAPMQEVNGIESPAAAADTELLAQHREHQSPPEERQQIQQRRRSLRLVDSDALQNLKTAAMLFVVTIVFTTTFIPAALMTLKAIDFNILIFYLYYLTHATNPLIYCFMNRNFREDLHKIFCPMAAQQRQRRQQMQKPLMSKQQGVAERHYHGNTTMAD